MLKGNPPRELSLVETCIGDLSTFENGQTASLRPAHQQE
jgi:hypothetical protein